MRRIEKSTTASQITIIPIKETSYFSNALFTFIHSEK